MAFCYLTVIIIIACFLCVCGNYIESSYSLCPNFCSGHGICLSNNATIACSCFDGYHGGDCSARVCPSGQAWFDFPSEDNKAHAPYTECSNMVWHTPSFQRPIDSFDCCRGFAIGIVEYALVETGSQDQHATYVCELVVHAQGFIIFIDWHYYLFTVLCPYSLSASGNFDICSGNGRCVSLRDAASFSDPELHLGKVSYSDWDSDMVHGCLCDDGWEGGSCSRRSCPKGDDPYTPGWSEVQVLECTCTDSCAGSFRLSFQGYKTASIPLNASAEMLKYRLEVRFWMS